MRAHHAVVVLKNPLHDTSKGDLLDVCIHSACTEAGVGGAIVQRISVYGALQQLIRMKGRNTVSTIETHRFGNGLQLLVEPKKNVKSCGLHWVFPAGVCMDGDDTVGASVMLAEAMVRGAGALDSRSLSDAMDRCGMRRSTDAGVYHLSASATMLSASSSLR